MNDVNEPGGVKIPGFEMHLPATWTGCVALSIFAIAVAGAIAMVLIHGRPENLQVVGNVVGGVQASVFTESGLAGTEHRRQFQFMTPMSRVDGRDSNADRFGDELVRRGMTRGWRRHEYEGQGRNRDHAWWWTITVDDTFELQKFVSFYLNYWRVPELYIERFDTYGNVLPSGTIPTPQLKDR